MPDRLSALDASFLYLDEPTTPMHVGSVAIFDGGDGFDHDRLLELIGRRIAFVPRYRQRVRVVPGRLANPVWVDDEHFDLAYHVRRSALPKPGSDEQLWELVARLQSRRLDRNRPLWEMYLVEGLSGGRFALVGKTHNAMIDGESTVDIGQVILDHAPEPRESASSVTTWRPGTEPSWFELVAGAVADVVRRPTGVLDTVRSGVGDLRSTADRLAGGVLTVARTAVRPAPASPLNVEIGEARRFATAAADLEDFRRVRKAHGGTVNDVVLATVAGALRSWLLTRGEPVTAATSLRALVPVSVRGPRAGDEAGDGDGTGLRTGLAVAAASRVAPHLVDLPVGEPSPVMRLHQVSYAMKVHEDSGQAVGAERIAGVAGFAPPTLHALGARVASGLSRRLFNVMVTNVPGPQVPLYAGSSRMLAAYPVVSLARGQAVSIGTTSYDGRVFFGLNADRDGLPDVDVLAQCLVEALAELVETAS
jgi:WS/DGAT/MGAT family acyltransferase